MYLFTYFKDNGQDGLHLAVSDDGLHYRALLGDASFLKPAVGDAPLMRDPNVCRGPDGTFHLVWTTAWTGTQIGYASSKDLVNWSPQRGIPVMAHEPTCRNTWAPEIAFDDKLGHFVIFWSSTIPGRFPETQAKGDDAYNHRLYYTTTTDFVHFEPTRLLWDPGFNVIDATFYRDNANMLWLVVKDETITPPRKDLRASKAESYTGPFAPAGPSFTESWVEGPTLVTLDGEACCFFDCYTNHRYGMTRSRDLATWTDRSTTITIPAGARHGTIIPIDDALGRDLERRTARPLVAQRADPHVYRHTDGFYYMTASVPEYDRIELRRSRTIAGLATAKPAILWSRPTKGELGGHIWAPEIHFIDGQWVIYFAAGRSEKRFEIRTYALTNHNADPLVGAWKVAGQIRMDWESFTLDAHTFVYRGQRYLCWAQHEEARGKGTSLYLAKMKDALTLDGKQVCISSPTFAWERVRHPVNEGPAALIRNGRVFLAYSASATDANYCMGLLTADENADLMDPASWAKSPEPVLTSDAAISQFGPGHNSFVVGEDGQDVMVYHARTYEKIEGEPLYDPNRATFTRVVRWRADGTPDFRG